MTAVVGVQHSSVIERNLKSIFEELSNKDAQKFGNVDLM